MVKCTFHSTLYFTPLCEELMLELIRRERGRGWPAGGGQEVSPRFCSKEWEGGSGKKAMLRDFQVANVREMGEGED